MKQGLVAVFAGLLLLGVCRVWADYDDYIPCDTDLDCKLDECCALSFTGDARVCREIGDDLGDPCGGEYFCPMCSHRLVCTPVPQLNELSKGCAHPANGTCTRNPNIGRPVRPRV